MATAKSFPEPLVRKAYEISYAVLRLADRLQDRPEFRNKLENHGISLLESAVTGDSLRTSQELSFIEYLMRLGGDSGIIYTNHANLVINEISGLNAAIAGYESTRQLPESGIEGIFKPLQYRGPAMRKSARKKIPEIVVPDSPAISGKDVKEDDSETLRIRQEAILQFIQKSGNCRLKDILEGLQDKLQDVGERTVRYDLQELVEKGIIERHGPGGPQTYYRPKTGSGARPETAGAAVAMPGEPGNA